MPIGAIQGSPILPVFSLMKSRSTIGFIPWPAFGCAFIVVTGFLTG